MDYYSSRELRYKNEVEKTGEYEYVRSFRSGEILPNNKMVKSVPYLQIKHKYCERIYEIKSTGFINANRRCNYCCGSYENSFAHHIEQELGLKLEDVWDFEKNTLNPYHIAMKSGVNIWIRCNKVSHHDSYATSPYFYSIGRRCPYCSGKKVHLLDSFAQYCIDNIDKDFLNKHWDWQKNVVNPFEISSSSGKKVWIKCQEKDYHGSYEISCANFKKSKRCPYCASKKVHLYDSFGYHHFDKVQSWHPDNDISPFRVSINSNKKFKFVCYECKSLFLKSIYNISNKDSWCTECSMSKGEYKISKWLRYNNVQYRTEVEYPDLIGVSGGKLRYDFYLPDSNLLIEYQGEFHDGSSKTQLYGQFEKQQEHDRRKREYAKEHNIKLLEIWYWDFSRIEEILSKEI